MLQYTTERELPHGDVLDIARLISEIELLSKMPELDESTSAYQRLLIAKRVLNIPRVEGDIDKGRALYQESCLRCHGEDGRGKGKRPMLAGQYTDYLRRQIGLILDGQRKHAKMEKLFATLGPGDLDDLFAYLSTLDD
jgi:cytochrome c553